MDNSAVTHRPTQTDTYTSRYGHSLGLVTTVTRQSPKVQFSVTWIATTSTLGGPPLLCICADMFWMLATVASTRVLSASTLASIAVTESAVAYAAIGTHTPSITSTPAPEHSTTAGVSESGQAIEKERPAGTRAIRLLHAERGEGSDDMACVSEYSTKLTHVTGGMLPFLSSPWQFKQHSHRTAGSGGKLTHHR